MNMTTRALTASIVIAALAIAGCGSDSKKTASTTAATTVATAATTGAASASSGQTLTIQNFQFSPLTVKAGEAFTIMNADGTKHTVTADDGSFRVDVPGSGTATLTIDKAGTYSIHCEIHSKMKGSIVVN